MHGVQIFERGKLGMGALQLRRTPWIDIQSSIPAYVLRLPRKTGPNRTGGPSTWVTYLHNRNVIVTGYHRLLEPRAQ